MKGKGEFICGILLALLAVIFGGLFLEGAVFLRLLIGLAFGYVINRCMFGYAGMANRAYRFGSTALFRCLMITVVVSSFLVAFCLILGFDFEMTVNPISLGAVFGGLFIGLGMAFTFCGAVGVLTDFAEDFVRTFIVMIFFSLGVVVFFPLTTSGFATYSFVSISGGTGVYFPDFFGGDTAFSYVGGVFVTALLAGAGYLLAVLYEKRRIKNGQFSLPPAEKLQRAERDGRGKCKTCESCESCESCGKVEGKLALYFRKIFVSPWSLLSCAILMGVFFCLLMIASGGGWFVTAQTGYWFMRFLVFFGVDAGWLSAYTGVGVENFVGSFWENHTAVANFGIIVGAIVSAMMGGKFVSGAKHGLETSKKDFCCYAVGGFVMALGTRLALGCNVGAMFTPISCFSLSGWIVLAMLICGGFIGNYIREKVYKK